MELSYHPPKEPSVLKESRLIEVSAPDEKGVYRIDWRGTFTAGEKDVLLKGGTWGGGYGGLAVRISQGSGGWLLINSEGRRDVAAESKTGNPNGVAANTHGKRARWADFSLVARPPPSPAASLSSIIPPTPAILAVAQRNGREGPLRLFQPCHAVERALPASRRPAIHVALPYYRTSRPGRQRND